MGEWDWRLVVHAACGRCGKVLSSVTLKGMRVSLATSGFRAYRLGPSRWQDAHDHNTKTKR